MIAQQQTFDEDNVPGEKWCTHCGVRKRLEKFHKDESTEDGRRNVCISCRSAIRVQRKEEARKRELERVEQEGLEVLGKLSSGGTFNPHINEVFESVMKPFGGVHGYAKHLWATYLACPPGSQRRVTIHKMILDLAAKVTQFDLAERQLELMDDKDIEEVMVKYLREFQTENNLPSQAVPMLGGEVIEVGMAHQSEVADE